ncbi:helix-turn-helix transcriptional regulator [Chitinimonas lacunae]|uniref:Helix-turn-helix transcriptional regulator n=1 Tax=Chitinimonas lacunae TaxID=1963018 RepID=A0ABV8MJD4_9NEIS
MSISLQSEIDTKVKSFAKKFGCNTYMVGYINPDSSERAWFIDNYESGEWATEENAQRDPLLAAIRKDKPRTQAWGPELYFRAEAGDIWEAASAAGLHSGVIAPIRPGGVRRMVVSLTRDTAFDGTAEQLDEQIRDLEQATHMLAGVVVDLFDTHVDYESKLTSGDKRLLQWAFHGCSTAEIADRVNLDMKLVHFRLNNIKERLGAGSAIQAAIMAARYGAITV